MKSLKLDQLQTFVEVIERGSFTAAGERLGLTQPAVSLQIRELERQAGVRLVERVGRKANATAAGLELLAHARRIDAAVAAALIDLGRHSDGKAGRVRIGTGATACIYFLPPILRELRRKLPGAEILVTTGNTSEILNAVGENDLDLGLVTLPVTGRIFDVTPLLRDDYVAIDAAEMPLLPKTVRPRDLVSVAAMILFEPGGSTRTLVDAWLVRAGISLRPAMSLGSVEAIKELVAAGLGCSVIPAMALTGAGEHLGLRTLPLVPRLSRTLGIVMRRDKILGRELRETIGALEAAAKAKAG